MGGVELMATVPTPRTWVSGDTPTATELNLDVRDGWGFLANPPRCKVYSTTGHTVTTSGGLSNDTTMTWDTEIYDTDGIHSSGSPSRLTCVTAGVYQIVLHVNWNPVNDASPGVRYAAVKLNAGGVADIDTSLTNQIGNDISRLTNSNTSLPQTNHISLQYLMIAGDYIEAMLGTSFSSQSTIVVGAASRTFFAMRWIGTS